MNLWFVMVCFYNDSIDASGLLCPEPLMVVRNHIRDMKAGEILLVKATDPTTQRDFTHFCHFLGHELLAMQQQADCYLYWIRKRQMA